MENTRRAGTVLIILLLLMGARSAPCDGRDRDILKEAAQIVEEGKLRYDKKDYYGAIDTWNRVLKMDPWNEEAKNLIRSALEKIDGLTEKLDEGFSLLATGKIDEAFDTFVYVKDNSTPVSTELYTPLVTGFNTIERMRNHERFKKVVDRGEALFEEGRYEDAMRLYTFARKFNLEDDALVARIDEIDKWDSILRVKREAIELFDGGQYEQSRDAWNRLLQSSPLDPDAPLYLSKIDFKLKERERLLALAGGYFDNGVALYRRKQYAEAIDQFENAIAMNYRVDESKKYIETIRAEVARLERLERENLTEKVAESLREGIKYYNLNQYRKSLSFLNEGLKMDPENTQIQEYILRDILALKMEEEKTVLPSSPFYKLIQDLMRLGTEAYEKKRFGDSVKYFEEILLIFPFNEAARINLTRALSKTDPTLAREILGNMLGEAKDLIGRDKKREAAVKLRLILEVDAGYREAQSLLKQIEEEKKEEKKVATEEEKRRSAALYEEGLALYKQEKLQDAARVWRQAVDLNPDFVEARVFLSRAETRLRNLQKISAAASSGEQQPEDATRIAIKRHYLDGVNYYMNGLYKEAITEWEEVLKLDPGNESAKVNIERAKKRLGYDTGQGSS